MYTDCIQIDNKMDTECVQIGDTDKIRLDKNRLDLVLNMQLFCLPQDYSVLGLFNL